MLYNPKFLDNTKILNSELKQQLNEMNNFVKEKGLSDQMIQSFGIDFIYTSAQIEGNTYSKAETIALIEYGRTAGGKLWSEAMMIQNLKKAFNYVNDQDLKFNLENIKNIHFILSDQLVLDSERGNIRNKEVKIGGSSYIPLVNQNKLNDELKYLILKAKAKITKDGGDEWLLHMYKKNMDLINKVKASGIPFWNVFYKVYKKAKFENGFDFPCYCCY